MVRNILWPNDPEIINVTINRVRKEVKALQVFRVSLQNRSNLLAVEEKKERKEFEFGN